MSTKVIAPPEESRDTKNKTGKGQGPRKRVSQACDRCRSRKDKCDGKKPACSTCIANGRECSYDTNVKKRGLPEGYVRGMEKLWGLAVQEVEDIEDNLLSALVRNDGGPLTVWNDDGNSENWVETWRKSHVFQGLERLLSSMSLEPLQIQGKRKRTQSDVSASKKTSRWPVPASKVGNESPPRWHASLSGEAGFEPGPPINLDKYESILSPSVHHRATLASTPAATIELPDLPSETWHLLDVYFSYTHTWLPIIEKHDLLRISYQYSQNRNTSSSGDHAALWAAIAYAKFQHRAINNIPRALGSVGELVWTAERMYSHARSFIPNEEGTLELGHVQALIILSLANLGIGHSSRAWLLIGQAVRIAIDLQLNQSLERILTPYKSKLRAKHVFLGCFVLDTLIAARLGRHPHLRAADVDTIGLVEEDGLEEWDPWNDCLNVRRFNTGGSRLPVSIPSTFNLLVQVSRILNEASCVTENARKRDIVEIGNRLQAKLYAWNQAQPSSSQMGSDPPLSLLPHQYNLRAIYFNTLAVCQLLSARQQGSADLEPCAMSARQITSLTSQHLKIFGLLIVPPIFESYMKTAYDVVDSVRSSIDNTHVVLNDWKHSLDSCLEAAEPAWPVFETLKECVGTASISEPRRRSEVAFDLISSSNHGETPIPSAKTPQSVLSADFTSHPSPQAVAERPRSSASVLMPHGDRRSQSFGQSSGHGLPQNPMSIYDSAHLTLGGLGSANASGQGVQRAQYARPNQAIVGPQQTRRPQYASSFGSDIDMADPLFNELMRLDATEWTDNWDQSLANLGFTDSDTNDQDFFNLCHEPDPLHPSNVFQQFVATQNAEATGLFDNSAFGSLGMGLEPFGFGDEPHEPEGIEAGQILQALSAGRSHSQQFSSLPDI